ncbi:PREDICTED: orofacial cleft 1 candidate gene 1 protein homolog [Crocodylus porosus]|uniref:orofacial cleft 1 candidate gene 1 protein homolog n=1 Tax=Crocodylus porosus TaxID=8502 RepID=UPI00093D9510|nr:PREDICTED: orofacial cleft 1 candidate gene 1 protein homolog [Crocodylus porosus]
MDSEVVVRIRSVKSVTLTEDMSAEETQALCPGCSSFRNISATAVLIADYVKGIVEKADTFILLEKDQIIWKYLDSEADIVKVEVFSLPCYISEKGQIDMDREKFQQKALKQTKQKKSKSAEFLMVKEERAATEGIENPAFNISSTDLSAYQPSEEKVIRHDKLDSTLAAHQQKLRLHAHAEPRGNEYSRNYFDPLMDEEINPRQCGMEVSGEEPVKLEEKILYGELIKLIDEENKRLEPPGNEDFSDSIMPVSFTKTHDFCKEVEDEVIPSYIVQFEKDVQDDIIMLGSFSLEQVRVRNHKTISSFGA